MTQDRSGLLERAQAVGQFVVDNLEDPQLSDDDLHHLSKVLRVRVGESVSITDGVGSWRLCDWTGSSLRIASDIAFEQQQLPKISIAFCLLKGDKSEWVVQKLTELGVDEIVPVTSKNTIVKWDEKKSLRNVERFQKIAYEASMQSRRVWLPFVSQVTPLSDVLQAGFMPALPGGEELSLNYPQVVIGPEGGFEYEELVTGFSGVDLGHTILRAETAANAAGGLLCGLRERYVNSSRSQH